MSMKMAMFCDNDGRGRAMWSTRPAQRADNGQEVTDYIVDDMDKALPILSPSGDSEHNDR